MVLHHLVQIGQTSTVEYIWVSSIELWRSRRRRLRDNGSRTCAVKPFAKYFFSIWSGDDIKRQLKFLVLRSSKSLKVLVKMSYIYEPGFNKLKLYKGATTKRIEWPNLTKLNSALLIASFIQLTSIRDKPPSFGIWSKNTLLIWWEWSIIQINFLGHDILRASPTAWLIIPN